MDFNPANQQLLWLYRKCYHFLDDIMLLDMIETEVQKCVSKTGIWLIEQLP